MVSPSALFVALSAAALLARPVLGQGHGLARTILGASKDNTLYQDATGSLSNGRGQHLFAGHTNFTSSVHRGLIAFDIAGAIPAGSTIVAVELSLSMSRSISGTENVELFRVSADWGEGASQASGNEGGGAPAATGDATWRHRFFNTTNWTTPGGDFAASASAVTAVSSIGTYAWSSPQMVVDVQGWLDNPTTNFGWLLKGNELVSATTKRFDSHENLSPLARPRLNVVFRTTRAAVIAVGSGCSGTNPLDFRLGATGLPTLGNAAFQLNASNGPANQFSLALYTLGFLPAPLPVTPNCLLWVDPLAILLVGVASLNGNGAATYPTPIPNDASLTGSHLAIQGVALDGAVPGGLLLSNALTLVLGT